MNLGSALSLNFVKKTTYPPTRSTIAVAFAAVAIFVAIVLPLEHMIDLSRVGRSLD